MASVSLFAELQGAAKKRSERRADSLQDIVEWDLNMRPLSDRLAPFVFAMTKSTDSRGLAVRLEITQPIGALNEPGVPESGTGSALWTAAIGLARYLEHRFRHEEGEGAGVDGGGGLRGRRVLELGCGTGLVSLVAAALGAHVVATDIPECLSAVTAPNLAANNPDQEGGRRRLRGSVEAHPLVWGSTPLAPFAPGGDLAEEATSSGPQPDGASGRGGGNGGGGGKGFDLVVASDVIYRSEHVPLLLATLRGVVAPGRSALVAFDRRGREGVQAFLRAVRGGGAGGGGEGDRGGGKKEAEGSPAPGGGADPAEVGGAKGGEREGRREERQEEEGGGGRLSTRGGAANDSGFVLREVPVTEMPPGFRFAHFGLVELTRTPCSRRS